MSRPFIQKIDGFVRQIKIRQIPHRKPHSLFHSVFCDANMMVPLQSGLQTAQDCHCSFFSRLFYHYRPESALQSRIFLNKFPVFCQSGGSQHLQFTPAKRRFEDICRIDSALCRSRSYNGVHFVHKQDHISTATDLRQHIPKPLFKFASVLCASHQICHIKTDQPLILQLGRHIPRSHSLGQSLCNGGLTHTRFSHQCRIVLILSTQNPDHRFDFPIPADHRLHFRNLADKIL